MGKIFVEVCLISARGLQRSASLWKRQWYGVGWVDPNSKYCTKVDSSGNANPVWRTKFSVLLPDDWENNVQDLTLNVQVFSRDPIFLTEKLHGSATILLKEFLAKHLNHTLGASNEEVGSYQLRHKKSGKPRGFIDISVRISEEIQEPNLFPGNNEGGVLLLDPGKNTHISSEGGIEQPHLQQHQQVPLASSFHRPENQQQPNMPYSYPNPYPPSYANPYMGGPRPTYYAGAGPSYQPPPPSNVGYINMPSSSGPPQRGRVPAGFAMGAGAGALAAGAVMFGDDIMSGFQVPPGLGDPSITIATDPLF